MSDKMLHLSPAAARRMDQLCDRFEEAWQAGERPRLEDYLTEVDEPLRPTLLRELLMLEGEYRYHAGEAPPISEWSTRFPDAVSVVEAVGTELAALADDLSDCMDPTMIVASGAELTGRRTPSPHTSAAGEMHVPRRLGEYRVLRKVGSGGMGVVYEGVQQSLGRHVALKVIPSAALSDPKLRERFRREAQATARLHHPNIVQIFEVGEHEGQPFLALELVSGPSLADRLREGPLAAPQAASLLETLARAMHHAHEHGIVHRDLTPANVLLQMQKDEGGRMKDETSRERLPASRSDSSFSLHPSAFLPKIADFGLAQPVDGADLTLTGEIVGTPGYMAPEQASGKSRGGQVGPPADVYALGAILYGCLTGRPPFQGASVLDALEQVRFHEPVPPSRLQPRVPRDLETICLKCLEKEPGKRYASAAAMADDLRRFLNGDPVAARRAGTFERLGRWCRRNPAPAAAVVLALVAIGAVGALAVNRMVTVQLRREQTLTESALRDAKEQRARADLFREQAERLSTTFALERGLTLVEKGDVARGLLLLGHSLQIAPPNAADLHHVIRTNLAAAYRHLPFHLRSVIEHTEEVPAVAFSPDGKVLLTGGRVSPPRRWDGMTGAPLGDPLAHAGEIRAVAFSADGTLMATAGTDWTARLWHVSTGKPAAAPLHHGQPVQCVAFSPDGKTVVTGSADGSAGIWDVATGELCRKVLAPGAIHAVAVSPDGTILATGGASQSAHLFDMATGEALGQPMRHPGEVWAVAFNADGDVLVTGSEEGTARFWEVDTGNPLGLPLVHTGSVRALCYSADGKILCTGGAYGKVRLWDMGAMKPLGTPIHHQSAVYAVALSPGGQRLASGGADGKVRLWEKPSPRSPGFSLGHDKMVYCLAFSPDGSTIVTGSADNQARLWDAATGDPLGKSLVHDASIFRVACSRDGRLIATASSDRTARLWDAATGAAMGPHLVHGDHVYAVTFSPDGTKVLTGCKDSTARLWDVATGRPLCEPMVHPGWVHAVAFSPDGTIILTGCEDRTARLWDAATGKPLGDPLQHRGPVRSVAFSPDGSKFATGTWDDGTARVWDVATRQQLGAPLPHQEHVLTLAFSPDNKTIATGTWDGSARLWDVATAKPLGPAIAHQYSVREVAFSPDGKTLVTGGFDRAVRSWELPVAAEGDVARIVLWVEVLTGLELDRDGVFRELDAATWQQRRQRLHELGGPPLASRERQRPESVSLARDASSGR